MRLAPSDWLGRSQVSLFRIGPSVLLASYVATAMLSYGSWKRPGTLGIAVEPCGAGACISWVMPAGHGWYDGARAGMTLLTANGSPVFARDAKRAEDAPRVTVATSNNDVAELRVIGSAAPLVWRSLWLLGGVFGVMGALVVLRRADLPAARRFGWYAGSCSIALAVGPAAAGPHAPWALVVQFISLLAVGATAPDFVLGLLGSAGMWRRLRRVVTGIGGGIVATYLTTVTTGLPAYSVVRALGALYVACSILLSIAILGVIVVRHDDSDRRLQARICLVGIGLGALPFVVLTLIPVSLGRSALVPMEVSILLIGIMPAAFAFAIMQHGMLGIRTLIHRGLVYAITSITLLVLVSGLIAIMGSSVGQRPSAIAGLVVLGVVSFFPLRWATHRLIDRIAWRDEVDHAKIIGAVHGDIAIAEEHQEAARVLMQRIAHALNLESAILYLGNRPGHVRPATAVGEDHEDVIQRFRPPSDIDLRGAQGTELLEIRWESNTLLLSPLLISGRFLGYVVWGPKRRGDIFVSSERRLIATMTPILTLVIQERSLSDERLDLNERLLRSSEVERARLASDLHDGPLQKAILLSGRADDISAEPRALALELVRELREVCTRLRPAILDDLGLIPALDWLVSEVPRRSTLRSHLCLHGLDEAERFSEDTELAIFRVSQEAINNAIKHSGASKIAVDLSRSDGHLHLRVSDDGKGFTVPARSSGLGLVGMRERVRYLNGEILIQSDPRRGTEVTVSVPIAAAENAQ